MAQHFRVHNLNLKAPGPCAPFNAPNQRFTMRELINEYLDPVYGLQGTTEKEKLINLANIAEVYKSQTLASASPKAFILLFDRVDEAMCYIGERLK